MSNFLLVAMTLASAAEFGPSDPARAGITSRPLTYLMVYGDQLVGHEKNLRALCDAPPDFLHVGHAVPLNSVFGPASDYSGFNPELVPADSLLARRAELNATTKRLHEAGIGKIICYINPSIMGGDHEKRLGFFRFYDHWEEYREALGLSKKPERSPEQWMQRERRSFAPWEPYPNYPLWRYEPCVNEPAWTDYQRVVARLIAESGYDGIFVDDCIMECRHDLCQAGFPAFLQGRYGSEAAEIFDSDFSLAQGLEGGAIPDAQRLRHANTYWFWQNAVARFNADIAAVGGALHPGFFTVPNWGAISRTKGAAGRLRSGKNVAVWNKASRYIMFEEAHAAGCFGSQDAFGYLPQYLYGLSVDVKPVIINYGPEKRHVEMGYAEAAAGGGGCYVQGGLQHPEIRQKWRKFYEENESLFHGFRLSAPVALVMSYDEACYGNDEHLRQSLSAAYALMAAHVPVVLVPKENLATLRPDTHPILLLPHVQFLSDEQLGGLHNFIQAGGSVAASGPIGSHDLLARPRAAQPMAHARIDAGRLSEAGSVVLLESLEGALAKRNFDLIDALDTLDEKQFNARLQALAAEPAQESPLLTWLDAQAGRKLAMTQNAGDVRTVTYERVSESHGDMLVHAVRYAGAIWNGEADTLAARSLDVQVALPRGFRATQARVLSPDAPEVAVKIAAGEKQMIQCALPAFQYYALLHLQLEKIAG